MEDLSVILIILTLAENFLLSLLITSILDLKIKSKEFVMLFVSVSLIALTVRVLPVTPVILVIFSLSAYLLLLKRLYDIQFWIGSIAVVLSFITYIILESILLPLVSRITGIGLDVPLFKPYLRILFFLPQAFSALFLSLIFRYYKINLRNFLKFFKGKNLELIIDDDLELAKGKKISSTMYLVLFFLVLQGLVIITLNWAKQVFPFFQTDSFFNSQHFINIVVIVLTLLLLWLVFRLVNMLKLQRDELIKNVKAKNLQRLNWELRMQQHDFNHHLSMINVMLKMGKVEQAGKYLKGVVDELQNIKEMIRSGNQALNALLYSKISRGIKKSVKVQVNMINPLSNLSISDWDLNRIVGNLIDNAIEALERQSQEKIVEVIIEGGEKINRLEVKTLGILISEEVEKRIFKRGFTSKKGVGHGLGLAICKELVERYEGKISIEKDSVNRATSFIVELPS